MRTEADFLKEARLILAGLNRKMYDEHSITFYLYEAYKKGIEDGKSNDGRQHHATYSFKGVF